MRILVVNAGSSSLKVGLLDGDRLAASYDGLPDPVPAGVDAVGHRVVHGGIRYVEPVVIDDQVERDLRELVDLAPLHQPQSLAGIDAARAALPGVPQVACFDTAFHATMPAVAATYPLPAEWRRRYEIRRYGFHGLSHSWAAHRARDLVPGARRVVTCHLGAGASLAAVLDGCSVDTTMGFTPLDGLVMATRCGAVDPGLVVWLQEQEGLDPRALADELERHSGLLALAGSSDLRTVLARSDPDATLAIEVYLHRLRAGIAAMTAALGGLDACVFTGGVGENAPEIRRRAVAGLGYLGLAIDPVANHLDGDRDISGPRSSARTLVVTSREDLQIARAVQALLVSP